MGGVILGAGVTHVAAIVKLWEGDSLLPWAAPLYSKGGPVGAPRLRLHPHPLCPSPPAPRVLCPLGSQPSAPGIWGLLRDLTQPRGGRRDLEHPSPSLSLGVFQLQVTPHSQGSRGTSGVARGAGSGDPDPHRSPLVTPHAEAAGLCLD